MGTGTIATEHMVSAIRSVGHEPRWVVSRNDDYARSFAEDMDIPRISTEAQQALADPAVNFIYVSAARARRGHYISAAAAAGKHVLCDGPLAAASSVVQALAERCERSGVVLCVNQPLRASTIHQTMGRLVLEGEIGTLRSLMIVRGVPFQSPAYRRSAELEEPVDLLLDISVQDIDLARFLTGRDPIEVSALPVASGNRTRQQMVYAINLTGDVLFQAYESFTTAELDSIVMLVGDQGTLIAHGTLNGKISGTLVRRLGTRNELIPVRERDPYCTTVESFASPMRQSSPWLCRGEDCVMALRTVEALAAAERKRRIITV
ncbi:gfo/Idh/MocA family oxidoreductase [Labrys okinawensis]|uniref:Gfo/Idh/MocA family oxidoreductase n=1 Tax=Labrys okinawensis TaxID=346911 RepID=A0A2S9QI62_9HYPH|nr:Gfo/Idh/MocA family oxidoreductase [Labrys okinawensis]PRH89034.1 gfo/Idh/MocA family oxidoreductase [Labrys okinawensis]